MRFEDDDALQRRLVVDRMLGLGLGIDRNGTVTIDIRTDKTRLDPPASFGFYEDGEISWHSPAPDSPKVLSPDQIRSVTWDAHRNAADIKVRDGNVWTYYPIVDDDGADDSASAALSFDPAKTKVLYKHHLLELLPLLYPEIDVTKAVCVNVLSGRICIDPALLFQRSDFPDAPSQQQQILIQRLKDADAGRKTDGTVPVDRMMPWDDSAMSLFDMKLLKRVQTKLDKRLVRGASSELVEYLAQFNPRNPFIEQIPSWDGVRRVHEFAENAGLWFPGLTDEELDFYVKSYFDTFLYQMARRALYGGTALTLCPIIIGEQGTGKTSLVIALGLGDPSLKVHNGFSGATSCRLDDPKTFMESFGRNTVVLELAEGKSLTSADAEAAKAFLDCAVDNYRGSYKRESEEHVRYFTPMITTNDATILRDETGNRRFVPLWQDTDRMLWKLNDDDFPERTWMLQLWAELLHSVRSGYRYDMTAEYARANNFPVDADGNVVLDYSVPKSSYDLANRVRSSSLDREPFAEWLTDHLDGCYPTIGDFVTTDDLYGMYCSDDTGDVRGRDAFSKMVSKHIDGLKWVKARQCETYGPRGWKRIASSVSIESFGDH